MNLFNKEEKKVEYLELIYDLIFVYMIGRNNLLLNNIKNGFVEPHAFAAYVLCTLAIIQVWNFTTVYINVYGRNGLRDHIFLLVNMYLLYFVGEGTRSDWHAYQDQYLLSWGLILVNIGLQYLLELRNHETDVWNRDMIKRMMYSIFTEAAIVIAAIFASANVGFIMAFAAIGIGIVMVFLSRSSSVGGKIDFMHLTERAMLYVVFTFGEMIIAVAGYFEGDGEFHWTNIYFSLMTFLIVVGLFLSYEVIYDHLIDREGEYSGMMYMLIHIFIIFAMNNITVSLEFMREDKVDISSKIIFMTVSVIAYFMFLFCLKGHLKKKCGFTPRFIGRLAAMTAAFAVLMIFFREQMQINIMITVIYVFSIYYVLYRMKTAIERGL